MPLEDAELDAAEGSPLGWGEGFGWESDPEAVRDPPPPYVPRRPGLGCTCVGHSTPPRYAFFFDPHSSAGTFKGILPPTSKEEDLNLGHSTEPYGPPYTTHPIWAYPRKCHMLQLSNWAPLVFSVVALADVSRDKFLNRD